MKIPKTIATVIAISMTLITLISCDINIILPKDTSAPATDSEMVSTSPTDTTAPVTDVITEPVTEVPTEPVTEEPMSPTEAYEKYIGVEYKIDMTTYEQYVCPDNAEDFLFIVNPNHTLSQSYVPDDLIASIFTRAGKDTQYLRSTAAYALEAFLYEGREYGINDVFVTSAYRSYNMQSWLFDYYVERDQPKYSTVEECIAHVLTYSTRPGTSEHQSGLSCDMHNLEYSSSAFAGTPSAEWLAANAHRFGFVLRYPEDKTDITGIMYEPWHFRFVGRVAATEMYESGLCLDEYLAQN